MKAKNERCRTKQECSISLEDDFPTRFALDQFDGQLLNVTYRCVSRNFKFRPFWDKKFRMMRLNAYNRLTRPPLIDLELGIGQGVVGNQERPN